MCCLTNIINMLHLPLQQLIRKINIQYKTKILTKLDFRSYINFTKVPNSLKLSYSPVLEILITRRSFIKKYLFSFIYNKKSFS